MSNTYWVHKNDLIDEDVDMSDYEGYEKITVTDNAGCSACNDETPFSDDVNSDMSFMIRGNIMFILEDDIDAQRCETVASFIINNCPCCGRPLQKKD